MLLSATYTGSSDSVLWLFIYSIHIVVYIYIYVNNYIQGVPCIEISSYIVERALLYLENWIEWFMNDRSIYNNTCLCCCLSEKLISISRGGNDFYIYNRLNSCFFQCFMRQKAVGFLWGNTKPFFLHENGYKMLWNARWVELGIIKHRICFWFVWRFYFKIIAHFVLSEKQLKKLINTWLKFASRNDNTAN
jgi:hypothetical protein